MKTRNEAEKLVNWVAGTLQITVKAGKKTVKPYLLKPNEKKSWFEAAATLHQHGYVCRGYGVVAYLQMLDISNKRWDEIAKAHGFDSTDDFFAAQEKALDA